MNLPLRPDPTQPWSTATLNRILQTCLVSDTGRKGNNIHTFQTAIPHKYSSQQRDAFECCCADGAGPNSQRGSHVYDINTWLWNFGRPQPRVGDLSVAKTEKIRRKSRSEASKR